MLAGHGLKSLRNKRNITVREVEQASRRIADAKGDKRFSISNGWLAQLENGSSEPSIFKLFSLSVIYRANFHDLVRFYNVDVDEKEKYEPVALPHLTHVTPNNVNGTGCALSATSGACADLATRLVPASGTRHANPGPHEDHQSSIIYGYLGLAELTMYPMIRPGAILTIDTSQYKLTPGVWRNEYERPIFFIELRGAYTCGWCELQGNQLLIIPHHSSPASVRRFTYPREAEIVGRVVSYSTPCVEHETSTIALRKAKAK